MEWDNKVVWSEGMFLRAQHFQQQDRYVERLVRGRTSDLSPYPWGIAHITFNQELLRIGKFAVAECRGVFPDGTPFSIPEHANCPPPLDIRENDRNKPIFLTLPISQPGGKEIAGPPVSLPEGGEMVGSDASPVIVRHEWTEFDAYDSVVNSETTARIVVGKPRIRHAIGAEEVEGYVVLQVAQLLEMRTDGLVILDRQFIPPCLDLTASTVLSDLLTEMIGLVHHRAEALGVRVSGSGARGVAEIADFLMLQMLNRTGPLLTHLSTLPDVHPERLYAVATSLAGELATFTSARKRPPKFPPYQHDALQRCFLPVFNELRASLGTVLEQTATPLPLELSKFGIWGARLNDSTMIQHSFLVLAVGADVPTEKIINQFPNQVKICSVKQIRDLVNSALSGIPVRVLPVAPRPIPFHSGMTYFELERNNPYWENLAHSAGIAIHIAGEFPGIHLELWAIKNL